MLCLKTKGTFWNSNKKRIEIVYIGEYFVTKCDE